ncbi:MAG: LptF/LptG family permease [Candidatus Pelagibacter sp.]
MLQNKIYQNYCLEIIKIFTTILLSLSLIAWTVRAVNFLDLIVESGYSVATYFEYSILNVFGIITKFIPLSFLLAISIFIVRQIQENEFIILWTSGVRKIQIVNLFLFVSIIVTIFHLLLSIILTPAALNKSRSLLSNQNLTSLLPAFKIQKFTDTFKGLTFIVDSKFENKISNIFLHDDSNNLNNIIANQEINNSTTIIAKSGIVKEKQLVLYNGSIISSKNNLENDVLKFEKIKIDLTNITNTTIKKPKIQETSTIKLIGCAKNNYYNDKNCKGNFKKEIFPTLNRRIILPLFLPLVALISSLLLIKTKNKLLFNKISIFGYSFIVLLYAELLVRYTGKNFLITNLFIFSPLVLSILIYTYIKYKFSKETKINA